jgi:hypothetical protein
MSRVCFSKRLDTLSLIAASPVAFGAIGNPEQLVAESLGRYLRMRDGQRSESAPSRAH